jgi:hypothetical protein
VEVTTGNAIVLDTTTGADGRYQLYGLPPNAGLRVSKQDYLTQEIDSVRPPAQDVQLVRLSTPGSYSGTYNLELEIGGCALPEDARKRTYTATIQGSDPTYLVTLSGADFMPGCGTNGLAPGLLCNQFMAHAAGDSFGLGMVDFDWGHGGQITELLPGGGTLSVVAGASARRDGSSLYGTGTGDVSYCARAGESRWACATTPNNCRSSNVQLRFTRR